MRLNCKFSADIANKMTVSWLEDNKCWMVTPVVSFVQDEAQMRKRFGEGLTKAVFSSILKSAQKNIPTEEQDCDITWAVSTFAPNMTFENHEVELADLGNIGVQPEFKSIVAKKKKPEVVVNIALPLYAKTKGQLGKYVALAGQHIKLGFSTQMPTPEVAKPTIIKVPDAHGAPKPRAVVMTGGEA